MKVKTIKLFYPVFNRDPNFVTTGLNDPNNYGYSVVQVTDSIEFGPNDFLMKATVDRLCNDDGWKVVIVGST
jgi:hypothetical protein